MTTPHATETTPVRGMVAANEMPAIQNVAHRTLAARGGAATADILTGNAALSRICSHVDQHHVAVAWQADVNSCMVAPQ